MQEGADPAFAAEPGEPFTPGTGRRQRGTPGQRAGKPAAREAERRPRPRPHAVGGDGETAAGRGLAGPFQLQGDAAVRCAELETTHLNSATHGNACGRGRILERGMKVGAMDDQIGRAPPPLGFSTERDGGEDGQVSGPF